MQSGASEARDLCRPEGAACILPRRLAGAAEGGDLSESPKGPSGLFTLEAALCAAETSAPRTEINGAPLGAYHTSTEGAVRHEFCMHRLQAAHRAARKTTNLRRHNYLDPATPGSEHPRLERGSPANPAKSTKSGGFGPILAHHRMADNFGPF